MIGVMNFLSHNSKSERPNLNCKKSLRSLIIRHRRSPLIRFAKLHKLDPYQIYAEIMKAFPQSDKADNYDALSL